MKIQLSDHFSFKKLLGFVAAPIMMMVFTSIYGVIDGFFVSNFAGKTPFAAINLIMPFLMVLGSVGFMLGTGGTAIVSKLLGEGKKEDANKYFSLFIYTTLACGIFFSVLGEILLPNITRLLGATEGMYDYCILYGRIVLLSIPCFMLQNVFQAFFSTSEKPHLGFIITLIAGLTNIILDALLVGVFKTGVAGAAIATAISQFFGAILPLIYFYRKNTSLLRLGKAKFNIVILLKACSNGVSEFVSNISGSIVGIVFNYQLMKLIGEDGVSAYGVMMYVNFIYVAIFIGYSIGTAPIIGYNYGAQNHKELKNIFKKSMILMGIFGVSMTLLAIILSSPIAKIFVGYDVTLFEITKKAFLIFSFSFIFSGFSIFTSSLFTALGNGIISALVSFLRTIVFQIGTVLILPLFMGVDGVWLSMLTAEILAMTISMIICFIKRKKYNF